MKRYEISRLVTSPVETGECRTARSAQETRGCREEQGGTVSLELTRPSWRLLRRPRGKAPSGLAAFIFNWTPNSRVGETSRVNSATGEEKRGQKAWKYIKENKVSCEKCPRGNFRAIPYYYGRRKREGGTLREKCIVRSVPLLQRGMQYIHPTAVSQSASPLPALDKLGDPSVRLLPLLFRRSLLSHPPEQVSDLFCHEW